MTQPTIQRTRYLSITKSDWLILDELWIRYDNARTRDQRQQLRDRIEDAVAACKAPPVEGETVLARGTYPADKLR